MEENLEKKPRRPRIGESRGTEGVGEQFEKVNYSQEQGENVYSQHSYGNRQSFGYNRQGGYSNNRQGGYNNNRQGGYGNRQGGYNNNRQGGYNQRQGGYNRYNNYNNYDNNVAEGEQQGNNNYGNRQGGYRQGGYNNNRQGGYSNNRQNGYGNRQGGYNNNRQGGYGNRQVNKKFNKGGERIQQMRFTPRPKRVEYEMPVLDPEEAIRLNKFMANAGVCSRRAADELIQKDL